MAKVWRGYSQSEGGRFEQGNLSPRGTVQKAITMVGKCANKEGKLYA